MPATELLSKLPLVRRFLDADTSPLVPLTAAPTRTPAVAFQSEPTLQAQGLYRSFGSGSTQTYALQNVAVELRQGEMNLLMGPSGSGKSTLLAVLSALLRPDTGHVRALGQDLWKMSERDLERFRLQHCSYIFQGYNLFPALTARQQLEVVLRWGEGVSPRVARDRADHVLGRLGLSKRAHLRPVELSGGEKQRVAIGRALVKNPSFVFADEPTSALDWENGQQVIELLTETAREHRATVLVVTHDHRLVPFADRVFEMADGQLQPQGSHTFDPSKDTGTFRMDRTMEHRPLPAQAPEFETPAANLWEPVYVM